MPLLKSRIQTTQSQESHRSNALKSTGPKTLRGKTIVSQNAFRHGRRASPGARPLFQAMATLGEDPGRYRELLADLVSSCPPRTRLELRLCQDVTRLLLMAERNQQAQEARLLRTFEKLETSRQRQQREIEDHSSYDALQSEVLENGLRRAPDSAAKFSETMACLERLLERVETGDSTEAPELDALYGKNPTFRGAGIINGFHAFAERPGDRDLAASLRMMLHEEIRNVAEEQGVFYREHVAISRAMRLECLAPADPEYRLLQRQETSLDRRIERKLKLLMALSKATGHDERDALENAVSEPLGWIDSRASASRSLRPARPPAPRKLKRAEARRLSPSDAAQAHDLSLRHKMRQPRPKVRQDHWEDVARSIRAIYGLEPDPTKPNPAPPQPPAGPETGVQDSVSDDTRRSEPAELAGSLEPAGDPMNAASNEPAGEAECRTDPEEP